jgi:peptide deformylase
MSVHKLTLVPSEILRAKSTDVVCDRKLTGFIKDLSETLYKHENPKGVGLSAPQIGKNWNVFVTLLSPNLDEESSLKDLRVFINPVVIGVSNEITLGEDEEEPILEGCLSIPSIYGPVPRHEWVELEYDVINGDGFQKQQEKFTGFFARVVQHEYDHLRGVLFTDYSLKHDLPIYEHRGKKMIEIDKSFIKTY